MKIVCNREGLLSACQLASVAVAARELHAVEAPALEVTVEGVARIDDVRDRGARHEEPRLIG